jgi:tetratricopeptide (TPR) repeat protein/DNA-binding CsgD family transcriptional regulator
MEQAQDKHMHASGKFRFVCRIGILLIMPIIMCCILTTGNVLQGQTQTNNLDSLLRRLKKLDDKEKAGLLLQIGFEYSYSDSLETGLMYLKEALMMAERYQQKDLVASANYQLGDLYFQFDDLPNAQMYWIQSYKLSEEQGNRKLLMYSITGLGNIMMVTKEWQSASKYFGEALRIANREEFTEDIPKILNQLGILFSNQGQNDSALVIYRQMLEAGKRMNDSIMMGFAYTNISSVMIDEGRYREAIEHLNIATGIQSMRQKPKALATILLNLGRAYHLSGQHDKALGFLVEGYELSVNQAYLNLQVSISRVISDIYTAKGDDRQALMYYKIHSELKDTLFTIEKQKQIQNLQLKNQLEQAEKQVTVLKQRALVRNLVTYFSTFSVLLLLIIFYLVYRSIRNKVKMQELERIRMVGTIDQQGRDLVSMAMSLSKKQELISEISSSTKSLGRTEKNEEVQHLVEDINQKIRDDHMIDRKWEIFKLHFNGVHPSFFRILQEHHPDLTPYELRYCAFIKLNMSAKDIAQINNISLRSVYMFRYRLKKKLHLDETEDLDRYLTTIC